MNVICSDSWLGIEPPIQVEIEIGARATASCKIMSAPFSAIITIAALVLPDTTVGMIEPSTTRRRRLDHAEDRKSTRLNSSHRL